MTSDLRIRIFADCADVRAVRELDALRRVDGFTTNPTLMRRAGVTDYEAFARALLAEAGDRPVSFEVLADELDEMARQAHKLQSWGANVRVKIPVTNTRGECTGPLVERLAGEGVAVNVTAVLTREQLETVRGHLGPEHTALVSIFAGRLADTGVDPAPLVRFAADLFADLPGAHTVWASCREVLNVFQAQDAGCDVITITPPILRKLDLVGLDPSERSLDTVREFRSDALASGLDL